MRRGKGTRRTASWSSHCFPGFETGLGRTSCLQTGETSFIPVGSGLKTVTLVFSTLRRTLQGREDPLLNPEWTDKKGLRVLSRGPIVDLYYRYEVNLVQDSEDTLILCPSGVESRVRKDHPVFLSARLGTEESTARCRSLCGLQTGRRPR